MVRVPNRVKSELLNHLQSRFVPRPRRPLRAQLDPEAKWAAPDPYVPPYLPNRLLGSSPRYELP